MKTPWLEHPEAGGGFDERPSILLVEDNMSDVHMVLRRLRDEEYGVRHVRTGADALEVMRHEGFYAVLLDHRLPDIPGTKVCRMMRENGVTIPILIFSSLQDEGLADAALKAGATDYLVKDIVMPHLARFLGQRLAMV